MPKQKLIQREDGRFKCKYQGKQFYGKTQAEAMKKRDDYIAAEKAGYDHQQDGAIFLNYALRWL